METRSVFDEAFRPYGKVIRNLDLSELIRALKETTPCPQDGSTIYIPGTAELESLPVYDEMRDSVYGGMPIQIGCCNGTNHLLNCLEYHLDSEVDVAADDVILLVAAQQKIRDGILSTDEVEAFLLPAGTAVELYATTLHYAPCGDGFRVGIVLPLGTNTDKPAIHPVTPEDKLLFARNKWLLAHPQAPEAQKGAWVGLTGENLRA